MAAAVAAAPEGMEVVGTSPAAVAAVAAPFLAAAMPVTLSAGPPAPSAVEMAVIAAAMGIAQNAPAAVAEEGGRRPTSVALAVRAETEGPAATEAAAEAEVSAIAPAATAALVAVVDSKVVLAASAAVAVSEGCLVTSEKKVPPIGEVPERDWAEQSLATAVSSRFRTAHLRRTNQSGAVSILRVAVAQVMARPSSPETVPSLLHFQRSPRMTKTIKPEAPGSPYSAMARSALPDSLFTTRSSRTTALLALPRPVV